MRTREANDSLEASVLRAVSVGGIVGGSCVNLVGEIEGGGVPGRGRVKGRMILARRGEERSCSSVSALLRTSIVLVMVPFWAAAMLWLMSLFAWCMIVSVEGFVSILMESATVILESMVWLLPFGEDGRSMGPRDPMEEESMLAKGEITPSASS